MAQSEIRKDFGRYLQNQRVSKDISIDEVSFKTKIRSVVLKQIENEDLAKLPDPTITKGFIRAYAQAVACDTDEALRRYDACLSSHLQSTQLQEQIPKEPTGRFWLRIIPVFIVFLILIGVTLYVNDYFAKEETSGSEAVQAPEKSTPPKNADIAPQERATPEPDNSEPSPIEPSQSNKPLEEQNAIETSADTEPLAASPTAIQEPAANASQLPSKEDDESYQEQVAQDQAVVPATVEAFPEPTPAVEKKVLKVVALELTWFKITIDGQQTKEMTLKPEQQVTFEANESFNLLIGNATGLNLELNGEPVAIKGKTGQVKSLRLP